jgi:hypothetical protein
MLGGSDGCDFWYIMMRLLTSQTLRVEDQIEAFPYPFQGLVSVRCPQSGRI